MHSATKFIWKAFSESKHADRKDWQEVDLFIDNIDDVNGDVANIFGNQIHLSVTYIEEYTGDVKNEITGVLYHEMARIWQWNGNGNARQGLLEGIADYIRLTAGYAPGHWVEAGQGDRWDQGYDVTARFLVYCNSLSDGFVADLNRKMRNGYNDNYFYDLLGKTVDQLWNEYKDAYKVYTIMIDGLIP